MHGDVFVCLAVERGKLLARLLVYVTFAASLHEFDVSRFSNDVRVLCVLNTAQYECVSCTLDSFICFFARINVYAVYTVPLAFMA